MLEAQLASKEANLAKELAELEKHIRATAEACHKQAKITNEGFIREHTQDLIQWRRHLRERGDPVAEISKLIQRSVRQDVRNKKNESIGGILEQLKGLRRIADIRNHSKKHHITAVVNSDSALPDEPQSIADAFAAFYEKLYASQCGDVASNRVEDTNREHLPKITAHDIKHELKQMGKKKAGDQAGLVIEVLQHGSEDLFHTIAVMFTGCVRGQAEVPAIWKQSCIPVLFKKGDATQPDNYRPITLLRMLCKLFARVLNSRIKLFLDASQSSDQAGVRKGHGCDGNLFTVMQVIEKLLEYQLPLWICAVYFRKAFDTVEHGAIWDALLNQGVPAGYVAILKSLYVEQVGNIMIPTRSREFNIARGTKQGDPMSPALFNAVLEDVFRPIQETWRQKGWGIRLGSDSSDLLCNLRLADDFLFLATSRRQLQGMLKDPLAATRAVGLEMHPSTKIMRMDGSGPSLASHGSGRYESRSAHREGLDHVFGKVAVIEGFAGH